MSGIKGKRKQIKSILVDKNIYDSLAELREFSYMPITQLLAQLFESKNLIPRTTINNFFEDFSTVSGQRKFKEWKKKKLDEEQDNERASD